jgi:2-hydroxychromene-2-carboxylate isomerase
MTGPLRFYFSFRSPYSWLAFERVQLAAAEAQLALEYLPVFPPADFPNDPTRVPAKAAYILADVTRLARAYGVPFKMPAALDCHWIESHAAFLYANDRGRGPAFAKAAYAARFERGEALSEPEVMARCAAEVGLDAGALIGAQSDKTLQERVFLGMIRGVSEDGLFGVPLLVWGGERFWGNDRIEWLLRHVAETRGSGVPDLTSDPLSPVHRAP